MQFTYGTRQHWDNVAKTRLLAGSRASEAMLASMLDALGDVAGKRFLDIGTGTGALPIELVRRGARSAVGIDVTPAGIELARTHAQSALEPATTSRSEFFEMDAAQLGFESGLFDAVTCLKTLWCLPRAEPCLAEWARVLSGSGTLVLQIYSRQVECPLLVLGPRLLGEFADNLQVPNNYRGPFDFSCERVAQLLQAAGFEQPRFEEHAVEVDLGSAADYWQTLRTIAGSAYYAYTLLEPEHGPAIERAWERLVARIREADGGVRLGLTWFVCTAKKPGH